VISDPTKDKKLEIELLNDNTDDFLFFLKCPLTDRIISKVLNGKKSIKFTNFYGLQYLKMHVIKF